MAFLFMLIGAAFGAWFCADVFDEGNGWTGALFGLITGLLFAQLRTLRARVLKLEQKLAQQTARADAPLASAAAAAVVQAPVPATTPVQTRPDEIVPAPAVPAAAPAAASIAAAAAGTGAAPPITTALAAPVPQTRPADAAGQPATARRSEPPPPTAIDNAAAAIKRWFTEGNVPVKVGVIVLFLGVAALFKYANDQGWLYVRMEFRLAGVAAAAIGGLVFAWRKRESHRAFALSLQGGAIGVLILTIFAAFKLYALLPAALAFALLVVVVAGAGMLAVLQDALALAVLAIVGGFLAPILISTGHGNHVALFAYYAVLNAAVFGIAWIRPWRALNLIGFAFTFGIGTLWGALQYRPEFFASTEPFLLLFFAFYLLLPLLYALRQAPERRDLIDGTLVFGTPLIAFALQVALLERERMPLAFSAIGAATIYAGVAALELRRLHLRLLGESHALLALGFATVAIPLALSAHSTACTWALEGAALVWLGLRQDRRLPRWIGYALQLFAGLAFGFGFRGASDAPILLNAEFLGAILIALAGLDSARLLDRPASPHRPIATVLFFWGILWWLFAFGNEIERHESGPPGVDWWLALFAFTALLASELYRRIGWRDCRYPVAALFVVAPFFIVLTTTAFHGGPLERWSAAAWALWLLAVLRALVNLRDGEAMLARILHFAFLWTAALLLGTEGSCLVDLHFGLATIWQAIVFFAPIALLFWLTLVRALPARWPLGDGAEPLRRALLSSLAALLGLVWLLSLQSEGDPQPLPYFVVFNPLELAQLGYLLLVLAWFRRGERDGGGSMMSAEFRSRALAVAGVLLLTAITLRGVHFVGGVAWSDELWTSPLAQAALSIAWTLAGIAAMLLGKQRASRAVWFGGAALMGVVLIKLLLIDRQFLHDLPAIIGVLVVGMLLVAVGYFAPVPPRIAPLATAGETP